ncbi:hypothetical protein [Collimonas sp. OK307]|uniref:hypothetical protein n=1 Tax=Collimonas sp. OK307 TaxID=1801620 RepID=UPI000B821C56|nr:hypothetical protein [Collimonas sp. OK307]
MFFSDCASQGSAGDGFAGAAGTRPAGGVGGDNDTFGKKVYMEAYMAEDVALAAGSGSGVGGLVQA